MEHLTIEDLTPPHPVALGEKQFQRRSIIVALQRFFSQRLAVTGLVVFTLICAMAIFAPWVTPGVTPETNFVTSIPFTDTAPSFADFPVRIFGFSNDYLLRQSILTLVAYGARPTLLIGLVSAAITTVLGTAIGLISGYVGGWLDALIMRIVDIFMAFPFLATVIILIIATDQSITLGSIILIFSLVGWTTVARLVRASMISLREREYAEAARAVGVPGWRIAVRHLLPNSLGQIIVAATLSVGNFILADATLDYLNYGITGASWGNIILAGRGFPEVYWWWVFFPGLFIVLTVLSLTYISDGVLFAINRHEY